MHNKQQWDWISMKDQMPTIKDLPFITYDDLRDSYDLWDDSDWFHELELEEQLHYTKWISIQKPK